MFHKQLADSVGISPAIQGRPQPVYGRPTPETRDLLRRRWTWVLIGAVLGVAAGVAFLLLATPRYTAQSQLLINPNDLKVVDNSLTASNGPSDANLAEVESQARVVVSETVLRQVVDGLHLDRDPEFAPPLSAWHGWLARLSDMLGIVSPPPADDATEALRTLSRKADARREERTYVVDLSVTTAKPEKSVRIAKAIVATYLETQAKARAAAAQRATGELSARLSDLQARVRDAEDRVEAYKAQNHLVNTGAGLISDQQMTEVSNQLVAARVRTDAARSRYDQIKRLLDTHADPGAMAEAVQSPTISGLRLQYAAVVRREAELGAQLGSMHPSVIDNRAQVARMRELIDAEVRRLAQAARGDYDRAAADQAALQRSLDDEKTKSVTTNQALVHLRELERDAEASRLVYQTFLNRSRETSQQEQLDTANVRIISDATLPAKSFPPSPILLLLFGCLVGALAGAGLALLPTLGGERVAQPLGLRMGAGA